MWQFTNLPSSLREEIWSAKGSENGTEGDRPEEDREEGYDGPPGMKPDGVIESNWDKVSCFEFISI